MVITLKAIVTFIICITGYCTLRVISDALLILKYPPRGSPCAPDDEGSWSIGSFTGQSPFNLTSPTATNPVLSCASITDPPSNFVADPFLISIDDGQLYMFFETKSNSNTKGEIAVATTDRASRSSWRHLGIALREPFHVSYPYVFQNNKDNTIYMLPETSASGSLRLYKAMNFPLEWTFVRSIIDKPLIDASIIHWNDHWYIFASDPSRKGYKKNGELQIFHSEYLLGPYTSHYLNLIMSGPPSIGARMAGRILRYKDRLYRFGQDCQDTYGRNILAFRIDLLTPNDFVQCQVRFYAKRTKLDADAAPAWNSVRRHHVDALYLEEESMWFAVMDGDSKRSNELSRPIVLRGVCVGVGWTVIVAVYVLQGGRRKNASLRRK